MSEAIPEYMKPAHLQQSSLSFDERRAEIIATMPFYNPLSQPVFTELPYKCKNWFTANEWHMAQYKAIEAKHGEAGVKLAVLHFTMSNYMTIACDQNTKHLDKVKAIGEVLKIWRKLYK